MFQVTSWGAGEVEKLSCKNWDGDSINFNQCVFSREVLVMVFLYSHP